MSPRKARRLPDSMPRRPRRGASRRPAGGAAAGEEPATRLGPPQVQSWPDGDWVVRQVPGPAAAKTYRCPGCDQEILPGVAHVVAWPEQANGTEDRRHWHNSCWQRRPRRPGPGPRTHR
ncbi:MAG TPA: ATP/GTP-binding protein [Streptosporangiaceae bacterium]|nr:ATP/GTP-binding protein [Streptosporangiaceae bacterium]